MKLLMFAEERREKIIDLLHRKQRVSVKDLAEQFHISIDSIRRDLSIMESKGLLKRTYGGAIPVGRTRYQPKPPSSSTAAARSPERVASAASVAAEDADKRDGAIAKAAASYIRTGDTIFLGRDPLHFALLPYLPGHAPLTVVTNSLRMAETLKASGRIETYMICGKVRPTGDVHDAFALSFVKKIKIDVHFLSGCGVSAGYGISMPTPEEAAFHRVLAEISRTTICLAGHRQVGGELFASMMPPNEADVIVTDADANPEELEQIAKSGVEVVVAPFAGR